MTQHEKALRLHALHQSDALLILPNVWDAGSALAVQQAGYAAVATSSAAVAYAQGYADGEQLPLADALRTIAQIARATQLPVTADFERGYAEELDQLQHHIVQLIETGAVGLNLEDSLNGQLRSVEAQQARLRAVAQVAQRHNMPLVLNARLDAFLLGQEQDDIQQVAARANAYRAAGATCIFVPGVVDAEWWRTFLTLSPGPANVMLTQDIPFATLAAVGVRRISMAAMPYRHVLRHWLQAVQAVRAAGSPTALTDALPYSEIKTWLKPN